MISARNNNALSEVIGFIMLIAVIMAAFSIYLAYSVPAQGRENEIKHMDAVKDELVQYKIGIDALWTNNQLESLMSSTITMGTGGAATLGSYNFLPMMQPVGSSGTVAINQRTPSPEWLNISSYSYVANQTYMLSDPNLPLTSVYQTVNLQNPPDRLIVNFSGISNIGLAANKFRGVIINGTDSSGTNWQVVFNLTQRWTFFQSSAVKTSACVAADSTNGTAYGVRCPGITNCCLVPINNVRYNFTDLTLTVYKNQNQTLSELILYDSVTSPPPPYLIDLLDDAYGLRNNIRATPTIGYRDFDPSNELAVNLTPMYAYQMMPLYNYTIPLGAVEYRSHNNYWIPQTYYYQMGGVFLNQSDGISSKVPPSISFGYNSTGAVTTTIIGIGFDRANTGSIGGTSPIQIGTRVKSTSGDIPYAAIVNNTMNLTINFTTSANDPNTVLMWKQVFQDAANKTGGIPDNQTFYKVGNTTNGAYIVVKGFNDPLNPGTPAGNPNTARPDIKLSVKAVNLTASIQSMSGV